MMAVQRTLLGRLLVAALIAGTLGWGGLGVRAAHADANESRATCLAVGASGVAPGTKDDISLFINTLADARDTTHGALIQPFVHQTGACVTLPPVPPHP